MISSIDAKAMLDRSAAISNSIKQLIANNSSLLSELTSQMNASRITLTSPQTQIDQCITGMEAELTKQQLYLGTKPF